MACEFRITLVLYMFFWNIEEEFRVDKWQAFTLEIKDISRLLYGDKVSGLYRI